LREEVVYTLLEKKCWAVIRYADARYLRIGSGIIIAELSFYICDATGVEILNK
jgi:hypothetical protein